MANLLLTRTHTPFTSSFLGGKDIQHRRSINRSPLTKFAVSALFAGKKKASSAATRQTIIPEPSYNLPLALLGIAGVSGYEGAIPLAAVTGLLGVFLTIQASRVKFVFGDKDLEVLIGDSEEKTENKFVGGENKWAYSSFTNWELWWPGFPVLVYFKETQTKPEGQIHFFPVIFNGKQLYDVMVERCGSTQNSGPKL